MNIKKEEVMLTFVLAVFAGYGLVSLYYDIRKVIKALRE